jgi:hypothetical protein
MHKSREEYARLNKHRSTEISMLAVKMKSARIQESLSNSSVILHLFLKFSFVG